MHTRDAVAAFLDGVRGEIADSTLKRYHTALSAAVEFLEDPPLEAVTPSRIRAFRSARLGRGVSPHTVNSDLRTLRRLFGWLVREGLVEVNPARSVPFVKAPKDVPKAITVDDIGRILVQLPHESPRDRALVLFLIDTGCRVGGAVGLTIDRLHVEQHRAIVSEKGERSRVVYFTDYTAESLVEWLRRRGKDPSPLAFLSAKGGGLSVSGAHQMIERVGQRAGVVGRCNPHSFRHAFARSFLTNGGNLASLGRILGHAPGSPVTAQYYAVWDDRELAEQHGRYSPLASLNGTTAGH